jgi:hypothetical protein
MFFSKDNSISFSFQIECLEKQKSCNEERKTKQPKTSLTDSKGKHH